MTALKSSSKLGMGAGATQDQALALYQQHFCGAYLWSLDTISLFLDKMLLKWYWNCPETQNKTKNKERKTCKYFSHNFEEFGSKLPKPSDMIIMYLCVKAGFSFFFLEVMGLFFTDHFFMQIYC